MAESVIRLEDVWKIYHMDEVSVPALSGMNIDIKKGEFVAVVGPSGSGKSTTMNMIGCLDIPTKGKVFLEHHDISKLSESNLAQIRGKKIGFVFQTFNLIPTLTALDNVMLPMTFQNIPREERLKIAKNLLVKVGLGHRVGHLPSQLSGGEKQRVAIARALSNNPEVILADEPTGNLDSKTGEEIMKMLKGLNKDGKTIVMVTHDTDLTKYAKKVIHIKDGKNIND
ncbi:ABC transporter ATP-binding protein [Candidatus Woesearchaeota archaeon]|nr:ABC transporter ATP-binding protein [Candidatus Woesearchaeota archaeon]